MSGEVPVHSLSEDTRPLVVALRSVLDTPDLGQVVLIGGLAVAIRVTAHGTPHRATVDIDVLAGDDTASGSAVELIAEAHGSEQSPLTVEDMKVDVISTAPVAERDLDGLSDDDRLFVAGHRWAYDTAETVVISTPSTAPFAIEVGSTPGLVAAKCHALGFPSARRRSTKRSSDLLDLFRLVDLGDREGEVAGAILSGPAHLSRIIADVVELEVLDNPAGAARQMNAASPAPIDEERIADSMGEFVVRLRG